LSDISLTTLIIAFFVLLLMSAFFSGSETALMSLNRYRLRHLKEQGHRGAVLASKLLDQPDRLIGLILIGNNFVNILITQLATYIGYRFFGNSGVAIATGVLTLMLLIFAEVAPKTLGAMRPERFAFPASFVYTPMMKIAYPLVWLINLFANSLLRLLGVPTGGKQNNALNTEELRSVVNEASGRIHASHQNMLLRILDFESVTVEDIMDPRGEIVGIDLDEPWEEIEDQLRQIKYTRMPVYRTNINNILGYIHIRSILTLLANDTLTREEIEENLRPAYFIPKTTTLTQQLVNFKTERRRHALVVDEYGNILGLVTLEDILGEIVGGYTLDAGVSSEIQPQSDDSWVIDGSITLRELNRALKIELPVDGPRTLNGLLLEYLEIIPDARMSVKISGYPLEIIKTTPNSIKTIKLYKRMQDDSEESDTNG